MRVLLISIVVGSICQLLKSSLKRFQSILQLHKGPIICIHTAVAPVRKKINVKANSLWNHHNKCQTECKSEKQKRGPAVTVWKEIGREICDVFPVFSYPKTNGEWKIMATVLQSEANMTTHQIISVIFMLTFVNLVGVHLNICQCEGFISKSTCWQDTFSHQLQFNCGFNQSDQSAL